MSDRVSAIQQQLQAALSPASLEIIDESHLHAGHAGARDGKGHFAVQIVSDQFAGLSPIKRHKLIYSVLADLMQTDIHALSIKALTPDEVG
jgi:BolA protein